MHLYRKLIYLGRACKEHARKRGKHHQEQSGHVNDQIEQSLLSEFIANAAKVSITTHPHRVCTVGTVLDSVVLQANRVIGCHHQGSDRWQEDLTWG